MTLTEFLGKNHVVTFWCDQPRKNYATPKARVDIKQILERKSVTSISLEQGQEKDIKRKLASEKAKAERKKKQLVTVLQYPLKPVFNVGEGDSLYTALEAVEAVNDVSDKTVVLVHDIKTIQAKMFGKKINPEHAQNITDFETILFSDADALILHSDPMANYVSAEFGLSKEKCVSLGMFDYLAGDREAPISGMGLKVIGFAGYLGPSKRELVEKLFKELPMSGDTRYNLYGPDFNLVEAEFEREDIVYGGSIAPGIIPSVVSAQNEYGLLWDTLNESQRAYYEMIFPHKCSLYLRAGVPLIVPSGTYAAEVVEKLGVGVVIDDLSEITNVGNPSPKVDYEKIEELRSQMSTGHFTQKALENALKKVD